MICIGFAIAYSFPPNIMALATQLIILVAEKFYKHLFVIFTDIHWILSLKKFHMHKMCVCLNCKR